MPHEPSDDRVAHPTFASAAYARLRRDIIRGRYLPGQKLHIGQLCSDLDTGLSPVREALNRLARDGLVNHSEQRGFQVAPISETHLDELTRTREWLNELAVRESIAHGDSAWEERVVLADHRLSKTQRARGDGESEELRRRWEDAHREFHASLVAACRSSWVIGYCDQLFDAAERYRYLSRLAGVRNETRARDEHRAIAQAAVARDADRATALLLQHFRSTAELVRTNLARIAESTSQAATSAPRRARTGARRTA